MMSNLRSPSCLLRILAIFGFLILGTFSALANDSQQLSGTVSDPSGAVVPSASVSIQSVGNTDTKTTQTDDKGGFEFMLPPGRYRIDIAATGFGPYEQDGIKVDAAVPLRLNVVLQVEAHQETVEVNAAGSELDLSSTQVGEAMGQEKLLAVPLNGRSFTDLLGLQAGVIPQSSKQSNAVVMSGCTTTPPSGDLNPGDVSVSGQRETANGFAVNGSSVEEDFNNIASVVPRILIRSRNSAFSRAISAQSTETSAVGRSSSPRRPEQTICTAAPSNSFGIRTLMRRTILHASALRMTGINSAEPLVDIFSATGSFTLATTRERK